VRPVLIAMIYVTLMGVACGAPVVAPDAATDDVGTDAAARVVEPTDQLDLLIAFDVSDAAANSNDDLSSQLPRLLGTLASGHRDGAVPRDFEPVGSMHVAFVSSDMAVGAEFTGGCMRPLGDDGVFLTHTPGCADSVLAAYPHGVFAYDAGGAVRIDDLARDASCVPYQPNLFNRGCGHQAPLEAALKAISLMPAADGSSPVSWTAPEYRPPVFFGGTFGHGSDPDTNGGFLRPDSVLAVLVVSALDECGTPNARLYSDDDEFSAVPPALRCYAFDDQHYPDARYVDALLGLRRDPERVVFSVVAGVPIALTGASPDVILADPLMQPQVSTVQPDYPTVACTSVGPSALPARRLTRVARGVLADGGHATVHSLCAWRSTLGEDTYTAIMDAIIDAMAGTR
jgi:hypothetical protein